jgi:predicted metal-dependent enzyme (double-stranded beta helix superfamily)
VLDLPAGVIHEVANVGRAPATSIHVYSPPLTAMTHYDATLRPTVTEMVPHEPPAYGVPVESVLDHPSARG